MYYDREMILGYLSSVQNRRAVLQYAAITDTLTTALQRLEWGLLSYTLSTTSRLSRLLPPWHNESPPEVHLYLR